MQVAVAHSAQALIDQLLPSERSQVLQTLGRLSSASRDQLFNSRENSVRRLEKVALAGEGDAYVYRVGTDLRMLMRINDEKIYILDVAKKRYLGEANSAWRQVAGSSM